MSRVRCQVVKLGGSLLDYGRLLPQWRRWWEKSGGVSTVLVVGGGTRVDLLRDEHSAGRRTEEATHWLAIQRMGENARWFAKLLGAGAERLLVRRLDAIAGRCGVEHLTIVEPLELMRHDEPSSPGTPLPCSWDVTSDSIAARIAQMLDCGELTLLKSSLPGAVSTYTGAARAGYVDRFFPTAAGGFQQVTCVNLRSPRFAAQSLIRGREP